MTNPPFSYDLNIFQGRILLYKRHLFSLFKQVQLPSTKMVALQYTFGKQISQLRIKRFSFKLLLSFFKAFLITGGSY